MEPVLVCDPRRQVECTSGAEVPWEQQHALDGLQASLATRSSPMSHPVSSMLLESPLIREVVPEEDDEGYEDLRTPAPRMTRVLGLSLTPPRISRTLSPGRALLPGIVRKDIIESPMQSRPASVELRFDRRNSGSSLSSNSEDDGAFNHDIPRQAKNSRSPSVVGLSWGIRGVGRCFDSKWSTDESPDITDEDDEGMHLDPNKQDAEQRLLLNTHINSLTAFPDRTSLMTNDDLPTLFDNPPVTAHRVDLPSLDPITVPASYPNSFVDPTHLPPYFPKKTLSTDSLRIPSSAPIRSQTLPNSPLHSGLSSRVPSSSSSMSHPSSPRTRFRRRTSQKRISLVAGRIVPIPPLEHPTFDPSTGRAHPVSRFPTVSVAEPPGSKPADENRAAEASEDTRRRSRGGLEGPRTVDDFRIEDDAGRGAYGLVKRCREIHEDGTVGPTLIMKQIIKSRILADCWKKHPVLGTIPIEIHVMTALSSSSYVLPKRRPWDPNRFVEPITSDMSLTLSIEETSSKTLSISDPIIKIEPTFHAHRRPPSISSIGSIDELKAIDPIPAAVTPTSRHPIEPPERNWKWREGSIYKGHPSIIPLLDFFEDKNFYYLILPAGQPSLLPLPQPLCLPPSVTGSNKFPSDLFDLVERYPLGLPSELIRGYLGQIADALAFLHSRGICHRDIKDENVVLAEDGRCWLIDFGSSGVVRKEGWDTFSGTLDYAGPEILRGERYAGPPQDIWAFGIVAYVLVVGECPFSTAQEAAVGLSSGCNALNALEDRCGMQPLPAGTVTTSPSSSPKSGGINIVGNPLDQTNFTAAPLMSPSLFTTSFDLIKPPREEYDAEREQAKALEGLEPDGGGRMGDAAALIKACLQLDVAQRPTFMDIMGSRYLAGGDGWVDVEDIKGVSPVTEQ